MTTTWVRQSKQQTIDPRSQQSLSWSQLSDLADAGVGIGAHSCSHPQLDQLPDSRLEAELRVSKEILESKLGRPVMGIAYPFGYSNVRVRRMARSVGYKYACVVGNRTLNLSDDLFALPRLTISRSTHLREFDRIVKGQGVESIFLKERMLTKGWAMFRRTRFMLRNLPYASKA